MYNVPEAIEEWGFICSDEFPTPITGKVKPADVENLIASVKGTKFDMSVTTELPEPILKVWSEGKLRPVAGRGMMGVISGSFKSGKSYVLASILSSHLKGGQEVLNFELSSKKKFIWFDTEQSNYFFQMTQRRIHMMAGLDHNVDNLYIAYHLRKYNAKQRLLAIKYILEEVKGELDGLVIDGYVDLMKDFNSLEESRDFMDELMFWTQDQNILLLGVLHLNKGDGKLRGHLGSETLNKFDFGIKVAQPKRNIYDIENIFGRFSTFETFSFSRKEDDPYGLPVYEKGNKPISIIS